MTQDLKQKKVAQIRALLSKTTEAGCTPAEADAAQAMAADLMAKYAVEMADLSDVDHDEIEEMLKYALNPQNTYPWNKTLACAVQTMTNTFLLQGKSGRYPVFTFYGAKSDVENATWMFKAYLDALAPMWKSYMRENGYTTDTAEKNAWYEFRKGVAMGVPKKAYDSRKSARLLQGSRRHRRQARQGQGVRQRHHDLAQHQEPRDLRPQLRCLLRRCRSWQLVRRRLQARRATPTRERPLTWRS